MAHVDKSTPSTKRGKRFGCLAVLGLIVIAAVIAAGATYFFLKAHLFPSDFTPVTLSATEEKVLEEKLEDLYPEKGSPTSYKIAREPGKKEENARLDPEPFSEEGMSREVAFTEREINGLLANNTDLADKLVIDLADDLISAKLLLPVDEDFPILGGKTLRLRSGVAFSFNNGKPTVILKGVTVMGVPVPNAWLGGLKNIDLVEEFGNEDGFWKMFAEGIEDIRVEEGLLLLKLKE